MKYISKLVLVCLLMSCTGALEIDVKQGPKGNDGTNGVDGKDGLNGHSIASQIVNISAGVLCTAGGNSLDIYLDMDDTLTVTSLDTYQGSLITCNGVNGLNGTNGLDGTNGTNGTNGQDGTNGTNGQDGATGAQGIPGAVGPQGIPGPSGAVGAQGIPGPQGIQGIQGLQGIQGPAGTSAIITAYTSYSCVAIVGTVYYGQVKNGNSYGIYSAFGCASNKLVYTMSSGFSSVWLSSKILSAYDGVNGIRTVTFN
jgi:hypothetical protein